MNESGISRYRLRATEKFGAQRLTVYILSSTGSVMFAEHFFLLMPSLVSVFPTLVATLFPVLSSSFSTLSTLLGSFTAVWMLAAPAFPALSAGLAALGVLLTPSFVVRAKMDDRCALLSAPMVVVEWVGPQRK